MSLHKTCPSPKSLGKQDIAFMSLLGPPHGECGSREVWEITTLILSKTDGLINTGGILNGSRPLQWECAGELIAKAPFAVVHIARRPPHRDFTLHQICKEVCMKMEKKEEKSLMAFREHIHLL